MIDYIKLSELTCLITKGTTPTTIDCEFEKGGVSFIKAESMNKYKFIEKKELSFISEDTHNELSRSKIAANDLLFSIAGILGKMVVIKEEDLPANTNQAVAIIRVNEKLDTDYLFYYLNLKSLKKYINFQCAQSVQANLNLSLLGDLPILYRNLDHQKKIAKVLADIDNKIELNSKINVKLESMAKLIFDYWFLQFDFPDENGRPYKSSGGKMIYNEELKREIPKGWKACKLGDVINRTGTGLNPRKNFKLGTGRNYYVTIKNIKQGKIILDNRCDKIDDKALEVINNRSDLRKGDVLFTSIQPVGVTYYINEKPVNWNINESVFTIRADSEKITNEFLYYFLSGDYVKSYTQNASAGSIHKGIRHGTLRECKFILPEKNITNNFTNTISKILSRHYLIEKENRKLKNLRDWLLPMLMNGQVTVK